MFLLHSIVLKELPEIKPIMSGRLHSREHSFLPICHLQLVNPGFKRLEAIFGVAEL